MLMYGKRAGQIDADTLLNFRVELRGEEYWASCAPRKRAAVTHE